MLCVSPPGCCAPHTVTYIHALPLQRKSTGKGTNFIAHMGKMIEEQETNMKQDLQEIYFNKMQYIMENLRKPKSATTRLAGLAQMAERAAAAK